MMYGYDKDKAVRFIRAHIQLKDHPELAFRIDDLLPQLIDGDMAYMHETGVLDEEGYGGDSYYEDDEALEYILTYVLSRNEMSPEASVKLAALIDDYMDAQQLFLESCGMVSWDD